MINSAFINIIGFNTQPHGGGCRFIRSKGGRRCEFQHTAARRRLQLPPKCFTRSAIVSTHSRTEAAATSNFPVSKFKLCFNTQPHGGGCLVKNKFYKKPFSFNTQPHGGGCFFRLSFHKKGGCFNTQPHGGGC